MVTHDVYITTHSKGGLLNTHRSQVVIIGIEKFISNIYDARHDLLKLASNRIKGNIPAEYYGSYDMENFKSSSVAKLVEPIATSPLKAPESTFTKARLPFADCKEKDSNRMEKRSSSHISLLKMATAASDAIYELPKPLTSCELWGFVCEAWI